MDAIIRKTFSNFAHVNYVIAKQLYIITPMKSILSLMSLCLMTTAVGLAQTQYYYGDANHDNRLTVADVTKLIETQDAPERIVVQDGAIMQGSPVQSVTMKQSVQSISRGQYIYVWSSTEPAVATFHNVEWISSNPEVATVDGNGKATAKALGTTTISCRNKADNQLLASCTLNVTDYVVYFGCPEYDGDGDIPLGDENPDGVVTSSTAYNYAYVRDDVGATIVEHNHQTSEKLSIALPWDGKKNVYLLLPWPIACGFQEEQPEGGYTTIKFNWNGGNYESMSKGCFFINGMLYLKYTFSTDFVPQYDRYIKNIRLTDPWHYATPLYPSRMRTHDFYYGDINHDGVISQSDIEILTNQILTDGPAFTFTAEDILKGRIDMTNIKLTPSTIYLDLVENTSFTIIPSITPEYPTVSTCFWSSSNKNIATVDNHGTVEAIKAGTVEITASSKTDTKVRATCKVVVVAQPITITLDQTSLTLPIGYTETLTASLLPDNITEASCQWTSSAPDVATVDANGKVTALSAGQTTITVTPLGYPAISASCQVTVQYVVPQSISLSQTSITLEKGRTRTLTATVLPETTTDKTCQWSSSDTSVATVDANGKVTALKEGTVTITATSNAAPSLKATCTVKVTLSNGIDNSYGEGDDFIWGN